MDEELIFEAIERERIFKEAHKPNETLIKLNILLVIYFHEKRYDSAMEEVSALVNDPEMVEYKAYLILLQGQICELQGKFDETLKHYCHAFVLGKWSSYVRYYLWNHIGFCWLLKKRFMATEYCCRKAILLDPQHGDAWKNLGVCLENQGKFLEAMGCYLKAVHLKIRIKSILYLRHLICSVRLI